MSEAIEGYLSTPPLSYSCMNILRLCHTKSLKNVILSYEVTGLHITAPLVKRKYARLLTGLKCSSDIPQAIMESTLTCIKDTNVYINDMGVFSKDWNHHVRLLADILCHLRENGFTINPLKCEWAAMRLTGLVIGSLHEDLKLRIKKI